MTKASSILYSARVSKGLTVRKLALLSGVSHSVISQHETGKYGIHMKAITALKLSRALDMDVRTFIEAMEDCRERGNNT